MWPGGAGGKGVWGAAGMVYEDEEPDAQDPNYDEVAQVRRWLMIDVEKSRSQNRDVLLLRRDATRLRRALNLTATVPRVRPNCVSAATVCSLQVLCYSTACKD